MNEKSVVFLEERGAARRVHEYTKIIHGFQIFWNHFWIESIPQILKEQSFIWGSALEIVLSFLGGPSN